MPKPIAKGEVVTKSGLARLTGRTLKTVDDWIRRGMPVVARGSKSREWQINSADALDWLLEDRVARVGGDGSVSAEKLLLERERARESKERADKYALENAATRRETIPRHDVVDYWSRMVLVCERMFRGIPLRALDIFPEMTPAQMEGLADLVDGGLRELDSTGIPEEQTLEEFEMDEGVARV